MCFEKDMVEISKCLYQADTTLWSGGQARNLLSACMRLIHEAVRVAAPGIRLIHEDQLASRRISLING